MRPVAAIALAAACVALAVCPADRVPRAAAGTSAATRATQAAGTAGAAGAAEAAGARGADGGAESGLHATLLRSRLFELQRALHLAVRNDGTSDVQVGTIQLDSPLFDLVEPELRDPLLRPGDPAVAMPLPFGDARCDATAAGPPQVVLEVDGDEVTVPLVENPEGLLADLHASECAVAALRQDVDVHLGDEWEQTGPRTVTGEVVMEQRRPGVATTVASLEGNVIFTLDTDTADTDTDTPDTDTPDTDTDPDTADTGTGTPDTDTDTGSGTGTGTPDTDTDTGSGTGTGTDTAATDTGSGTGTAATDTDTRSGTGTGTGSGSGSGTGTAGNGTADTGTDTDAAGNGGADGAGPVLRVDDGRPTDRVGVSITASRCDAHALIEYKRTFTFLALVDVGEDRPVRLDVKAEGDTLRLLEDVLTRCIG